LRRPGEGIYMVRLAGARRRLSARRGSFVGAKLDVEAM
jgi:hypothetical protein